jgi:hypothetical protein
MKLKNLCWIGNTSPTGSKEEYVKNENGILQIRLNYENQGMIKGVQLDLEGYLLTKEQLLYLHSIDSVKETIEEWFPSEFHKLEVGKWYIDKCNSDCIIFNSGNDTTNYGFGKAGVWAESWWLNYSNIKRFRLATDQEVTKALAKEAVKRGFKDGCTFIGLTSKYKWTVSKNINIVFQENHNILELYSDFAETKHDGYKDKSRGKNIIFDNGIWAEIVSEPIELTLDQVAEKFGYNVSQIKIVK